MDYISIGSSPCDEKCAQVGESNYSTKGRAECRAYANQLRRTYGEEPAGAVISTKGFPHDFGTYYEVVCYFEEGNEKAQEYAFKLEEGASCWDAAAHAELSQPRSCNIARTEGGGGIIEGRG